MAIKAAQYVRMSTENQKYSITYQTAVNAAYALERGYDLVTTFADAGISGLSLARRTGLQALLSDVVGGAAGFEVVLVYDVSRWGRFQDPDESAHYEFLCRAAGVAVEYTGEAFANDGSVASHLLKQLKRTMAAEYSRELSDRITLSKARLGRDGYWPGGNPGFGLRRRSVGPVGDGAAVLAPGQRSAIKGNRVEVVLGPIEEVETVRCIFDLCVTARLTPNAIARRLNDEDRRDGGRRWTQQGVRRVLANELYIGTRVLHRASVRLGKVVRNPPDKWVRLPGACEPIVSASVFRRAQTRLVKHPWRTDEDLDHALTALLARAGRLSHNLIARDPDTPSPSVYRARFGTLCAAYARIGYVMTPEQARLNEQIAPARGKGLRPSPAPLSDEQIVERLRALLASEGYLTIELMEVTPGLPRIRTLMRRFGSMGRVYELAGYTPTARQVQGMTRKHRSIRSQA